MNTRARQGQKVVHTYTVGNPGSSAVEPAAESAPAVAADAAQDGSTLPITGTGLVGRVSNAGVVLALAGLMVSGLVRRRRPS